MLLAGLLAMLLSTFGAASGTSAASAAEPGVGLYNPSAVRLSDVRSLGTPWVRVFATWTDLEPARGAYSAIRLAAYEQLFSALPPGTKVIVDVVNTPRWETGSSDQHTPPKNPNEYAAFLGMLAHRWSGHVAAYEIWNEEDESRWWTGGPNPAAYVQLLKATYPVVKAADPNAQVILGGLTGNDYRFVEQVYQAGGKGLFDAVGVHTDTSCNIDSPYTFVRDGNLHMIFDSFLAYREVRGVMLANGDNKPIWMTELSWRTTDATCSEGAWAGQKAEGVTPEQQATYLSQAYHCLAQDPYVQVALWFPLQDEGAVRSGLVSASGAHKPSFAAMRSYVHEGDRLTETCGVFTGPKINVVRPSNRVTYTGALPIHVWATSSQGVAKIALRIDGKLIRNYTDRAYPSSLSGAIEWQGAKHIAFGQHTLTFLAFDKQRNESKLSLTIFHGRGSGNHQRQLGGSHGVAHEGQEGKKAKRHVKAKRHAKARHRAKKKHGHHAKKRHRAKKRLA